ncbi:MAG: methyltransferase domain-containing protein [Gammaproteobacteria bacterium]|nr:methyltransferase domain-containing protein [Gammaproteobacteria bacterium]
MKDQHEKISSEYTKALKENANSIVKSTGGAKFAGYSDKELSELPEDITETSFGCGNPLAFSRVQKGQTVLDLGSGAGLDLLLAAQRVGSTGQVIGVDMTDEMLSKARKNIEASGYKNIVLKKGKIESLPIESNSVDWVISNCVINLSPEKDQVFSEISRVLKPGGKLLISDIVAQDVPWWVRKSGVLTAACAGGAISEQSYLQKLEQAGLVKCDVAERQHYEPSQIAYIVVENLPNLISRISCCRKSVAHTLLTKLAKPVSRRIWSSRFYAELPAHG